MTQDVTANDAQSFLIEWDEEGLQKAIAALEAPLFSEEEEAARELSQEIIDSAIRAQRLSAEDMLFTVNAL